MSLVISCILFPPFTITPACPELWDLLAAVRPLTFKGSDSNSRSAQVGVLGSFVTSSRAHHGALVFEDGSFLLVLPIYPLHADFTLRKFST